MGMPIDFESYSSWWCGHCYPFLFLADDTNLGRLYNLTDGSPSPRGQIVEWLANKIEVDAPSFKEDDKEDTPNRKISSQRIMEELNWSPKFPSYIHGYESLLG